MRTPLSFRAALACLAASTAVLLTSCGAPTEPAPQSGGATLSDNVLPYDDVEFLTNRPPVLQRGKECDKAGSAFRALHLKSKEPLQYQGCSVQLSDARITVAASPAPFSKYWYGETDLGTNVPGTGGFGNSLPSSFQRKILAGKYHAVEYLTDADNAQASCHTAVDTGSAQPLVVTTEPQTADGSAGVGGKQPPPLSELLGKYCPAASKTAEQMLPIIDPQGGSRAR